MSSPVLRVASTRTAVASVLALGVVAIGGVTSAALADGAPQPTPSTAPAVPTVASVPAPVPATLPTVAAPVPAGVDPTSPVHVDAGGGSAGDDTVWLVLGATGALLAVAGAGLGLRRA